MPTSVRLLFLSLMVMSLLACREELPPEELTFPPAKSNWEFFLDDHIDSVMTEENIPGLAIGVIRNGRIDWNQGYGFANIETGQEVTKNTPFMLTRPADMVVTTVLLQVMRENGLGMDDDINAVLPTPIVHGRFSNAILTPRMLLTHTSGILDNGPTLASVYTNGDTDIRLRDFIYGYFNEGGAYFSVDNYNMVRPGRVYEYSRMNIALAAYLVEAMTGLEFDLHAKINLFNQLGYSNVSHFLFDLQQDRIAVPYQMVGSNLEAVPFYGFPMYPSGQLRINVEYLSRFLLMLMQEGKYGDQTVLTESQMKEAKRVQFDNLSESQALGWKYGIVADNALLGLSGSDLGQSARFYIEPVRDLGIILLSNGSGYDEALDQLMSKIIETSDEL
ncbi:MAG: serine hydrolase [Bacteroidota bacterium]